MSAALRFLALVTVGWVGLRAAGVSLLPDFPAAPQVAAPPPAGAGGEAMIPSAQAAAPAEPWPGLPPGYYDSLYGVPPPAPPPGYAYAPPGYAYPAGVRIPRAPYYHAYDPRPVQPAALPIPPRRRPLDGYALAEAPQFYAPIRPIDQWSLADVASAGLPVRRSAPAPMAIPAPAARGKLDRVQLAMWALLRDRAAGGNSGALANGGTLGGSQAGMRLTYAFDRRVAASVRSTSPIGGRGVEVAAGVRYRPLQSLPLWITAERRQAIGRDGGRSAFALFAETGLYGDSLPLGFTLDAYGQGGVVGARRRDWFADGAFTATRPLWKNYAAGVGVWAGAQPGLYRVDAGPRLTMKVRGNMRVHLDWRQRIAGAAAPGSGPAVTLAGDF